MAKPQRHVFVCSQQRPAGHPRGCCTQRGGTAVLQAFWQELKNRNLYGDRRAPMSEPVPRFGGQVPTALDRNLVDAARQYTDKPRGKRQMGRRTSICSA